MLGNLWGPEAPPEEKPLDLVVYRSRLIGSDSRLVVWGGGNTSVKTIEPDHLGHMRAVVRVKGTGTDLKTIDASGFPGVFRDDILPLLRREDMTDEDMVAYLQHCMVEPGGRRPSIETLLHGFLPYRHVDHSHANAIVAITNHEHCDTVVREALGPDVGIVPYRRPGFVLSKQVCELAPSCRAIVLVNHGLLTWGETAEESYRTHVDLVAGAEAYLRERVRKRTMGVGARISRPSAVEPSLLRLRGRLGHVIMRIESGDEFRALVDRGDIEDLAMAGPATPDHTLRIRPWPCVLDVDEPESIVDAYEHRYRMFFRRHAATDATMLSPLPKVFLVPGLGMITAGNDARDAMVTAEVALQTLSVAASAKDAFGSYVSFSERDLFDVEYWPLELYKTTLAPPVPELQGRIVVVTGAASGIGRAVALHLAVLGAQLVLLDLDDRGLTETVHLAEERGGSPPHLVHLDLTHADAVRRAVASTVQAYGGIDGLVSNAGIAAAGMLTDLHPDEWRRSMDVNATSHFLITSEVMKVMKVQNLGGSIVYVASKNAFGPGAGFGAYSAAKAAQVQLARIAALEGGSSRIRSNIVNPDAVFDGSGLWTQEVRAERAAVHGVPVEELQQFYAQRNLLRRNVSAADVAEAVTFLLSDRSQATTGTVIAVDGGIPTAFPR